MSRPRLDAEQKKVSFSLAFSPNLIAALEKVRGAKSQSVFVEEWLRQQPQIAAELAAMNDPGFIPPIVRYEQLVERLLAFYSPRKEKLSTIARALLAVHKVIISEQNGVAQELEEQIYVAMEAFWLQERRKYGSGVARGESLEAARPAIKEYVHYYYHVLFLELARGDRKVLHQRLRSLVRGCETVYKEYLRNVSER
ncbi:hypothetical protein EPA93_36225 [Ktedonosporobacter rubrisoli]|uniref:Uncharacterized protein n=1 Tax=Ktedonosporobacter rubrisoli TaxID=2509675 RepID=A0A4P6K0H7_KTERU|nr:hypothetical protein [Ktedonosporobacter rubrisoli]QBD81130.1 hypothetical protein EPA93_36225 [Ktedonosporobacter rubrisoli]